MKYEVYVLGVAFHGWKKFSENTVEAVFDDFMNWYSAENSGGEFVFLFFVDGKLMSYEIGDKEKVRKKLEVIKNGRS
ncbi:MAG: hypothetical protein QXF80_06860 [Thermoplasmatales archaeon]